MFAQSRPKSGLITQAEVRAIALAELDIQPASVVWDIGAGSGSVAIEAARLSDPGTVYAIEQDAADYHLILANAETFGVTQPHGGPRDRAGRVRRPAARRTPIFVGGTGHEVAPPARSGLGGIAAGRAHGRQRGDAGKPQRRPMPSSKRLAGSVRVLLVNIARGTEQLETLRFEAVNPTFLLAIGKPAAK